MESEVFKIPINDAHVYTSIRGSSVPSVCREPCRVIKLKFLMFVQDGSGNFYLWNGPDWLRYGRVTGQRLGKSWQMLIKFDAAADCPGPCGLICLKIWPLIGIGHENLTFKLMHNKCRDCGHEILVKCCNFCRGSQMSRPISW